MPGDIIKAQNDKKEDLMKYRLFQFGDHKIQKNMSSLSHPYSQEIEIVCEEQKDDKYFSNEIKPQKYDQLESTPF